MRKIVGLLVLVYAGWAGSASAATLVVSGGQLMGATGVEVNGASYDVEFVEGSCNSLFNNCTDFTFTTSSTSQDASQALLDQVFIGVYDTSPALTNGIETSYQGVIFTPYGRRGSLEFDQTYARNKSGAGDEVQLGYFKRSYDLSANTGSAFARWSPASVSAVPLPAAAWLFISAIVGLTGAKRMSRSKHAA